MESRSNNTNINPVSSEKEWFDIQFEHAQLHPHQDSVWFEALSNGRQLDPETLQMANGLIAKGSINLQKGANPEMFSQVMEAREAFYEMLGWHHEDHPLHKSSEQFRESHIRVMPLVTLIETARVLTSYNIDVRKVVKVFPAVLSFTPKSVRNKIEYLSDIGFDAVKIINVAPKASLGLALASQQSRIKNLTALGLDAKKVISTAPGVLGLAPGTVQARVVNLNTLGLDAVKIISTAPATLNIPPETIATKLANLSSLGLNAEKIINTAPSILGFTSDKIRTKLKTIYRLQDALGWQGDVSKLIEHFPSILRVSLSKMMATARFAADHGQEDWQYARIGMIGASLVTPLDCHMGAIASDEDYSITAAVKQRKQITPSRRRIEVLQTLDDEMTLTKIGYKSLRAYFQYQPLQDAEAASHPHLAQYFKA